MINIYQPIIDLLLFYSGGQRYLYNKCVEKVLKYYNSKSSEAELRWIRWKVMDLLRSYGLMECVISGDQLIWRVIDDCIIQIEENKYILQGSSQFQEAIISDCLAGHEKISLHKENITNKIMFSIECYVVTLYEDDLKRLKNKISCDVVNNNYQRLWECLPSIERLMKDSHSVDPFILRHAKRLQIYDFTTARLKEVEAPDYSVSSYYIMHSEYGSSRHIVVLVSDEISALEITRSDWTLSVAYALMSRFLLVDYSEDNNVLMINERDIRVLPYIIRRSLIYRDLCSHKKLDNQYVFNKVHKVQYEALKKSLRIINERN